MGGEAAAHSERTYVWMLGGCFCFTLMGAASHALRSAWDWQGIALVWSLAALGLAVLLPLSAGKRLVCWPLPAGDTARVQTLPSGRGSPGVRRCASMSGHRC